MHLIHFSLSMRATSFFFQVMASTGQLRKQRPHLVHSSGSTSNLNSSMQRLAGHLFSNTCASYSSLKYLKVERTGLGPVCPNPQRAASFIVLESSSNVSISSGFPRPAQIFSSNCNRRRVPSRQGVHLPQDSSCTKSIKNRAMSTIHEFSSITMAPPDPIMAPTLAISS